MVATAPPLDDGLEEDGLEPALVGGVLTGTVSRVVAVGVDDVGADDVDVGAGLVDAVVVTVDDGLEADPQPATSASP